MKEASKYKILQIDTSIQALRTKQQKVDHTDFLLTADEMDLLTKQEVADLFKVTVAAVSRWITLGLLHPTKIGRLTRISRAELSRFIEVCNPEMRDRLLPLSDDQRRLARLRQRVRKLFLRRRAYDQDLCEV